MKVPLMTGACHKAYDNDLWLAPFFTQKVDEAINLIQLENQ